MSDLIEKVARASHDAQWEDGFDRLPPNGIERALAEQVARAAIAAVAEWLDPKEIPMVLADAPAEIIAAYLRGQLEQPKGAAGDGR
jgi:hypothetical protein